MGEEKERGAVTVCKDGDDGVVLCYSEYGTTVGCGVTTNFQDENWNREGGDCMFNFFWVFRFLQLCCFCRCPCGSLTSSQACLLLAPYAFPLFWFFSCSAILDFRKCWYIIILAGHLDKVRKTKGGEQAGVPISNDDIISISYIAVYIPASELRLVKVSDIVTVNSSWRTPPITKRLLELQPRSKADWR